MFSCFNNVFVFLFNSADLVIFIGISDDSNFYAFVPRRYVKCTRCTEKRTIWQWTSSTGFCLARQMYQNNTFSS